MKKHILSIALTVALLISLIPLGAVTAGAESSFVTSTEMIDILKDWEGFSPKPFWDYKQWTVGYGTSVPAGKLEEYKANGISQEEATQLLAESLASTEKSLNSFIDKFGLTVDQAKFDALMSISLNCGTAWLYKPSTLRTAVVEGWTGDDFIFAYAQWSNSGNETIPALVRRRLTEANLYLNGVYAGSAPEGYGYVCFDTNGGESEIRVQGYDLAAEPQIRAVPTYENYTFEGWYTDPTGGEKVTKLDAGVKGYTLYAHWSAGGETGGQDQTQQITGTPVDYEKQVATGTLNSFQQPVKGALVVDAYPNGQLLKIVAEYTDASGIKWGQVSGGGWINLEYTTDKEEEKPEAKPGVEITVTGTNVNIRRGPSTSYAVVGRADKGDALTITETASGSGYLWGKSEKGWIVLQYTDYQKSEPEKDPPEETTPPTEPEETPGQETVIATGKVTLQSGSLRIRKGPSTGHQTVGSLSNGSNVEIYETKTVGAAQWGRIDKGWICLTYVKLDEKAPDTTEPEPTEPEETEPEATEPEETEPEQTEPEQTEPEQTEPEQTEPEQTPSKAVTGKISQITGRLNVRSGPGTNYNVVGWLTAGQAVTITEQKTVGGTGWGKTEKGWICMEYVKLDAQNSGGQEEAPEKADPVKGTVTSGGSRLRVRSGPGSGYSISGYLDDGAQVEILEQQTVNGVAWGRVEKGWINLDYVELEDQQQAQPPQQEDPESFKGTVTATVLYIRSGAGTTNSIVGRLYNGESVTVLETKDVDGTPWGRTEKGWICLDYVKKS